MYEEKETRLNKIVSKRRVSYSYIVQETIKLYETVQFGILVCVSVDKKNQLDVTFCILYFYSNSCSICIGQPCDHHQELTTA